MIQDIESDQKLLDDKRKECPFWAMLIPSVLLVVSDVLVCKYFIDTNHFNGDFLYLVIVFHSFA